MFDRCFLGANTPRGFVSLYEGLFEAPAPRLRLIKGGPGCGKSTLMKRLAAQAEARGLRALRVFCSGDPDSLDGVILPSLGLAVVDGTAPHVLEPPLCGCGAEYLDLSVCLKSALLAARGGELRAAKAKNQACYGPAYACLQAAAALRGAARKLALSASGSGLSEGSAPEGFAANDAAAGFS